jgi:hypothetical protein
MDFLETFQSSELGRNAMGEIKGRFDHISSSWRTRKAMTMMGDDEPTCEYGVGYPEMA